jgi:hypothetical protein
LHLNLFKSQNSQYCKNNSHNFHELLRDGSD